MRRREPILIALLVLAPPLLLFLLFLARDSLR
jgi:hypothetical protein